MFFKSSASTLKGNTKKKISMIKTYLAKQLPTENANEYCLNEHGSVEKSTRETSRPVPDKSNAIYECCSNAHSPFSAGSPFFAVAAFPISSQIKIIH